MHSACDNVWGLILHIRDAHHCRLQGLQRNRERCCFIKLIGLFLCSIMSVHYASLLRNCQVHSHFPPCLQWSISLNTTSIRETTTQAICAYSVCQAINCHCMSMTCSCPLQSMLSRESSIRPRIAPHMPERMYKSTWGISGHQVRLNETEICRPVERAEDAAAVEIRHARCN